MKKNSCCKCRQVIDEHDFYMNSREGKICSDCLVQAGPIDEDCAQIFKPRGPKTPKNTSKSTGAMALVPSKLAL